MPAAARCKLLRLCRDAIRASAYIGTERSLPRIMSSLPAALAFPDNIYRDGAFDDAIADRLVALRASSKDASNFRIAPAEWSAGSTGQLSLLWLLRRRTPHPAADQRSRSKMLGGVAFTDLRRTVIDKMITAGGWVVNDRATRDRRPSCLRSYRANAGDERRQARAGLELLLHRSQRPGLFTHDTFSQCVLHQKVAADAEQFLSTFQAYWSQKR